MGAGDYAVVRLQLLSEINDWRRLDLAQVHLASSDMLGMASRAVGKEAKR